jgi:5-formyltetrahydrofolate cyclo-ligase
LIGYTRLERHFMMKPSTPLTKAALRVFMRSRRSALDLREERSAAICACLAALDVYHRARAIHCYLPIQSEVDTLPLVRQAFRDGKRVAVPVVDPNGPLLHHRWLDPDALGTLVGGAFGTRHPAVGDHCDPAECDLFIVPLLAFDRSGRRLGYGKGHYDRLLSVYTAPAVGVAFASQEVQGLPAEPHDVPLTAIVTEDEVVSVADGSLLSRVYGRSH